MHGGTEVLVHRVRAGARGRAQRVGKRDGDLDGSEWLERSGGAGEGGKASHRVHGGTEGLVHRERAGARGRAQRVG